MSREDDQRAAEELRADDEMHPDQCRYCPHDADRDEAGHLHCIECAWTDNPGKIVGLYETIDGLRAELHRLRSEVAALRDAGNALADRTQDIDDGGDAASEVAAWRSAAGGEP